MPDEPPISVAGLLIVSEAACSCYALLRVSMAPKSTVPKDLIPVGVVAPTLDFWLKSNRLINRILLWRSFYFGDHFWRGCQAQPDLRMRPNKKGRPIFGSACVFNNGTVQRQLFCVPPPSFRSSHHRDIGDLVDAIQNFCVGCH